MPEKFKDGIRQIVAAFIFVLGLSVVLYPYVAHSINAMNATHIVSEYLATTQGGSDEIASNGTTEGLAGFGEAGEDIIGALSIPKLTLELPIYLGPTDANLAKGIAHLEGTSLPVGGESTHSVLCGHSGSVTNEWFTHIDQLVEGDLFYLRSKEQLLTYKVISHKVISPQDVSELHIQTGKDLVTLLTCTPDAQMRVIVTGERVVDDAWQMGNGNEGEARAAGSRYTEEDNF